MREDEDKSRKLAQRLRREMPNAEALLWTRLRRRQLDDHRFRRQHPIGPYVADFACVEARLVVEIDGGTHSYNREIASDVQRTAFLNKQGWRVHRVWNHDVYDHLDDVMEGIAAVLPPSVPKQVRDTSPVNGGGIFKDER